MGLIGIRPAAVRPSVCGAAVLFSGSDALKMLLGEINVTVQVCHAVSGAREALTKGKCDYL